MKFFCQFLKAQPLLPQGWSECTQESVVGARANVSASSQEPKDLLPCQVRLEMGKREGSAGMKGKGQYSKAIR